MRIRRRMRKTVHNIHYDQSIRYGMQQSPQFCCGLLVSLQVIGSEGRGGVEKDVHVFKKDGVGYRGDCIGFVKGALGLIPCIVVFKFCFRLRKHTTRVCQRWARHALSTRGVFNSLGYIGDPQIARHLPIKCIFEVCMPPAGVDGFHTAYFFEDLKDSPTPYI